MATVDQLLEIAPAWRHRKQDAQVVVRNERGDLFSVSMPVHVAWSCSCGATASRPCEHMAIAELSLRWWRSACKLLQRGLSLPLFKKLWLNTQSRFGTQVAILRMIHHARLDGTGLKEHAR